MFAKPGMFCTSYIVEVTADHPGILYPLDSKKLPY